MDYFSVFLRGVNVNGTRMKMEELKSAFTQMDYQDIKTFLASGNVVTGSDEEQMTLLDHRMKVEMGLSLYFGYEAHVIVKSHEALQAIVKEAEGHSIPDNHHHYLLLTNDEALADELVEIFAVCKKGASESLEIGEHGIYWIVAKGNSLESEFGDRVLGDQAYRHRVTSRTMNTVRKVAKYLNEKQG